MALLRVLLEYLVTLEGAVAEIKQHAVDTPLPHSSLAFVDTLLPLSAAASGWGSTLLGGERMLLALMKVVSLPLWVLPEVAEVEFRQRSAPPSLVLLHPVLLPHHVLPAREPTFDAPTQPFFSQTTSFCMPYSRSVCVDHIRSSCSDRVVVSLVFFSAAVGIAIK